MLVERTSFLIFPVNENVQCLDQVFIQIIFSNFRIGPDTASGWSISSSWLQEENSRTSADIN